MHGSFLGFKSGEHDHFLLCVREWVREDKHGRTRIFSFRHLDHNRTEHDYLPYRRQYFRRALPICCLQEHYRTLADGNVATRLSQRVVDII